VQVIRTMEQWWVVNNSSQIVSSTPTSPLNLRHTSSQSFESLPQQEESIGPRRPVLSAQKHRKQESIPNASIRGHGRTINSVELERAKEVLECKTSSTIPCFPVACSLSQRVALLVVDRKTCFWVYQQSTSEDTVWKKGESLRKNLSNT